VRTFAGIASLPGRPLEQTLRSLRGQVDEIGVYLNGYPAVPAYVRDLGCHVVLCRGNAGAAAKLSWAAQWDGLYFACDDDLVYPPDYVATLRAEWERWGPGVIVTACGRALRPEARSWGDWLGPARYIDAVPAARWVNYFGAGAFLHHTALPLPLPVEPANEDDAVLAVWAQRAGVPIRLVARPYDWPTRIPLPPGAFTLYEHAARERFASRTRIIRQVSPWTVHVPVTEEVAV